MKTESFAGRQSIPFTALLLSAGVGAISVLFPSPLYYLAALFYVTLMVLFLLKQDWAIYSLLLASFCTALSVEIGSVTVRPDQAVAVAIVPSVFLLIISFRRPIVITGMDWLILLYLFCNVFSSLLNSPDRALSFQKCTLLAVTFLGYFLTTQLINTRRSLNRVLLIFLVVGVLEAMYGVASVLLYTQGIHIGGAHAPFGDLYGRGTFLEGNIFGSFQMMLALVLISLLFNQRLAERRALILISLPIVLAGLVVSFTRAAWIAFVIGLVTYMLVFQRHLFRRYVRQFPLILLLCMLIAILSYGYVMSRRMGSENFVDVYANRLTKVFDYKSQTSSLRLRVWVGSARLWLKNPVFGNGTDSIKVLAAGTTLPKFGEDHWIPNSMLLALHDTGLVGLLVFSAIQIAFLINMRAGIRKTTDPFYRSLMEGFFVAFIGVQFTYLFTNGFWLIFIWVFMGIGICCVRFAADTPIRALDQENANRD
jgi:hypothetical protein